MAAFSVKPAYLGPIVGRSDAAVVSTGSWPGPGPGPSNDPHPGIRRILPGSRGSACPAVGNRPMSRTPRDGPIGLLGHGHRWRCNASDNDNIAGSRNFKGFRATWPTALKNGEDGPPWNLSHKLRPSLYHSQDTAPEAVPKSASRRLGIRARARLRLKRRDSRGESDNTILARWSICSVHPGSLRPRAVLACALDTERPRHGE
jgi:hypothetical protein